MKTRLRMGCGPFGRADPKDALPRIFDSQHEGGFTLVEMLVALALLALIAIAGLKLVDSLVVVQGRTDGRLERVAEIDRALFLIDTDFTQSIETPRRIGTLVGFRRHVPTGGMLVGYGMVGGSLLRAADGPPRPLISGVTAADWQFHRSTGWSADAARDRDPDPPDAVALTLTLAGQPGGTVRRVILLPAQP